MKRNILQILLTSFVMLLLFAQISFAATPSPTLTGFAAIIDEVKTACDTTSLCTGISFVLLVIIFTVIFKQGTARMLPNHSRGAAAIAVALAIFGTVAILAKIDGNPLVEIGKNILFPLLLFALFAGSVAILRWINSAQVNWFGKFLMWLGFFVMFLFAFLQILGFALTTGFAFLVEAVPWLITFLTIVLTFAFILLLVLLFFAFFVVRSIFDLFDGDDDDDSALGRSRKKRREKQLKDKDTVEQLNQLKKSFQKMRNSYDDKEELLREIAQMEPITDYVDELETTPSRATYRRY